MAFNNSLLPPHFEALEHALDATGDERLQQLHTLALQLPQLWNADTCPAQYLDYLAWAVSVDYWSGNWPEPIKRNVIKAAPELHRIKGTPAAVKMALRTLGVNVDYQEWHEMTPQGENGTFALTAYVSDNLDPRGNSLLSEVIINQLFEVIDSVKRGSQHYHLTTGHSAIAPLQLAGAVGGSGSVNCIDMVNSVPVDTGVAQIAIAGIVGGGYTYSCLFLEAA